MKGRLFVHIGPPKTATTSLQVALEGLTHARYSYAGTFQPRERNSESLSQRLLQAVSDELEPADLARLRFDLDQLAAFVDKGGVALLSEEILSLNQPEVPFSVKIGRLTAMIVKMPVTILVTLRDPVDALPSLYQEIYHALSLELQLDFARFCNDERAICYDYPRIAEILARGGLAAIRWLDFISIENGTLSTADVFGEYDLWKNERLMVDRTNVGIKSDDGQERYLPRVSLRQVGRHRAVQAIAGHLNLQGTGLTRRVAAALDRIKLRPAGLRRLKVPASLAIDLRAGYEETRASLCPPRIPRSNFSDDSHGVK